MVTVDFGVFTASSELASSLLVASMTTLPRISLTRSVSSEASDNSNSECSAARKYEPGISSTSTRPDAPVLPYWRHGLTSYLNSEVLQ